MAVHVPEFGTARRNVPGFTGDGVRVLSGSFQATAAAVTTVSDSNIRASSNVIWWPANAAAGLLARGKTCYVATGNSAGSFVFTVSATGAGAPAGSETFDYFVSVENP